MAIEAVDVNRIVVGQRRGGIMFNSIFGKDEIAAVPAPDRTAVEPPGRVEAFPIPEKRRMDEERARKNQKGALWKAAVRAQKHCASSWRWHTHQMRRADMRCEYMPTGPDAYAPANVADSLC